MADTGINTVRDIRCIYATTPGVICRIIGRRHVLVNSAGRDYHLRYKVADNLLKRMGAWLRGITRTRTIVCTC